MIHFMSLLQDLQQHSIPKSPLLDSLCSPVEVKRTNWFKRYLWIMRETRLSTCFPTPAISSSSLFPREPWGFHKTSCHNSVLLPCIQWLWVKWGVKSKLSIITYQMPSDVGPATHLNSEAPLSTSSPLNEAHT